MGDRYGRSDITEMSMKISIWKRGHRYGIWANDMGDDRIDMVISHIDMVISHIDMGYLDTLPVCQVAAAASPPPVRHLQASRDARRLQRASTLTLESSLKMNTHSKVPIPPTS
jgi:hypothetical protein